MKQTIKIVLLIALSLVSIDAKSYKYDDLDRLIEVSYESGEKIYYSYDSAGNMLDVKYELKDDNTTESNSSDELIGEAIYHLNDLGMTNEAVVAKIKDAIDTLENIKPSLDELNTYDGDKLKQEYDGIKKLLDDAKKSIDDIKQAIDNNIADNDEKDALKKEADGIKKAIDDIKKLIDGYKKDEDNSPEAIKAIKAEIDKVIAMMRSGEVITAIENKIAVPKGRSLISGNIAIDNLSDAIYAIWIIDNAKWYGYSPHADVREQIKAKYRLIEGTIPPHKAVLVWATEDTTIDVGDDTPIDATHIYGSSLTMHGADNRGLSITGVECSQDNHSMTIAVKLMGDVPSVYMAEKVHEELESFSNIYQNDGYFVLCEKE
jgi:YD repeat-containing protein